MDCVKLNAVFRKELRIYRFRARRTVHIAHNADFPFLYSGAHRTENTVLHLFVRTCSNRVAEKLFVCGKCFYLYVRHCIVHGLYFITVRRIFRFLRALQRIFSIAQFQK